MLDLGLNLFLKLEITKDSFLRKGRLLGVLLGAII